MLISRSGSAGHSAPPPPQSIEAVRRRARHRLIGAVALVLLGVLGFPLLFDTQPRPIAVDIPIEIPSRNPPGPSASKPEPTAPVVAKVPAVTTAESLAPREEVVEAKTPTSSSATAPSREEPSKDKLAEASQKPTASAAPEKLTAQKPADKIPEKATDKAPEKLAEKVTEKATDKPNEKAVGGEERIVVQVGAFAEVERAREARLKLERAGLKTYTHVAETPQGRRIRVRMGPFATRVEADKAAARAKALGLPAALLWL
jgi:DedD protein